VIAALNPDRDAVLIKELIDEGDFDMRVYGMLPALVPSLDLAMLDRFCTGLFLT
jgi:hypothetical protein